MRARIVFVLTVPIAAVLAWALAGALAGAASAQESRVPHGLRGELSLSTGFDFRTGDYAEPDDTDTWYVPFSVAYLLDDFAPTPYADDQLELAVTVPYLEISGPGVVVGGTGGAVDVGRSGPRSSEAGLGDVVVRATYIVFPPADVPLPAGELSVKVKLPTAERGTLGTGEPDTSLRLDLYQRFGSLTPLAAVGYRFRGESSGFDLRDSLFASGGVAWRLAPWLSAGLLYDWSQAASDSVRDAHELLPYASVKLGPHVRVGPYGVVGLSRGSPDYGVGLQLKLTLEVR